MHDIEHQRDAHILFYSSMEPDQENEADQKYTSTNYLSEKWQTTEDVDLGDERNDIKSSFP